MESYSLLFTNLEVISPENRCFNDFPPLSWMLAHEIDKTLLSVSILIHISNQAARLSLSASLH